MATCLGSIIILSLCAHAVFPEDSGLVGFVQLGDEVLGTTQLDLKIDKALGRLDFGPDSHSELLIVHEPHSAAHVGIIACYTGHPVAR